MGSKRTAGQPEDDNKPILIRHLTENEVERLKALANRNLRTMSAEATVIIREALNRWAP